jgi:excisionase family DNA binding protein
MRVKDVAERIEVSTRTVYDLIAARKPRCHRIGMGRGTIRVTEEQLADFLAGAETRPPAPLAAARPKLVKSRHFRHS